MAVAGLLAPAWPGGPVEPEKTRGTLLGEMMDGDHGEDHPNFVGLSWMYR